MFYFPADKVRKNTRLRVKDAGQQGAGEKVEHHFVDVNKMIDLAKGAQRHIEDFALTRYACYFIAQNGNPNTCHLQRM